jgi:hypothetical protein
VNERELRAYLLGQASEASAARLEDRLLEDDELFQVLECIEDDLFDDYARGRLDVKERARFEARYGTDGDRQRFARALSRRVDSGPRVMPVRTAPAWRRWAPLAAAAAVVVVMGGVVLRLVEDRLIAPRPPVPVSLPAPPSEPRELAYGLVLGASRAAAEPTLLTIPRNVAMIQLRVRLNPADRFDSYVVDLRSETTDTQVWQGEGLHATIDNGDLVVAAHLPAFAVPDGMYEVAVRGVRRSGPASDKADLGFVTVKVEWR